MTVQWPDRRGDVLVALDLLAAEPPATDAAGHDPRRPNLTDAVHWLLDDTGWDERDPVESVGTLLRSDGEAAAVRRVVSAVLDIARRRGATAPDADWFGDESWQAVHAAARTAAEMCRADRTP